MFKNKVHHNACRPFTQDGHTRRDIFNRGCGWASPLQRWWLLSVVLLYCYTVNVCRKKGSSANMPLLPKALPSPTLGAKSFTQCSGHSLCPRYTGVVTATYAGPGQLGFVGLPHGKCAWVMHRVNKSLRVEPLLTFKHLFQQYFIISTAYKNTHQTSFDIRLQV